MERARRRTRSQAAPDWTSGECLTLANEISAIEGEWKHALASFQKWQLVVENCNALEVNRSLDQCRKKWDALRGEYKKVKPWRGAYWSFDAGKREELGLPLEFDRELFKAIDRYVKLRGGGGEGGDEDAEPDTDPDSDPEIPVSTSKVFWETGPKKQRRKIMPRKRKIEESFHPWRHTMIDNVKQEQVTLNEMPEPPRNNVVANVKLEQGIDDEREKMMAAELLENAELITAILQGNIAEDVDYKLADLKNVDAMQTDITRRQGDKLIDCLGKIANTLNQLCDLVQESN